MATLKWKRHIPGVLATPILIADLYKMIFLPYTGFIWVVLPLFPLAVLAGLQRNLYQNANDQVYEIHLLKNGMQVEITNLVGRKRTHPIRSLRKCSDKEVLAIYETMGDQFSERMQTFFPVVVHSTGPEKEVIDVFWINHSAPSKDKFLLQAICNGQEIETSADATGVDFTARKEEEINI